MSLPPILKRHENILLFEDAPKKSITLSTRRNTLFKIKKYFVPLDDQSKKKILKELEGCQSRIGPDPDPDTPKTPDAQGLTDEQKWYEMNKLKELEEIPERDIPHTESIKRVHFDLKEHEEQDIEPNILAFLQSSLKG